MEKVAKKRNVFIQFLGWYFLNQSNAILKAWKNLLVFNLNYFSIPLLLKTFFYPWRRYVWPYSKKFNLKVYLEAFVSNSISRGLGAILRFFLILIGILAEILIIFLGIAILIVWIFLPLILIASLIFGFQILT